jgi:hypothetical protein
MPQVRVAYKSHERLYTKEALAVQIPNQDLLQMDVGNLFAHEMHGKASYESH